MLLLLMLLLMLLKLKLILLMLSMLLVLMLLLLMLLLYLLLYVVLVPHCGSLDTLTYPGTILKSHSTILVHYSTRWLKLVYGKLVVLHSIAW